MNPEARRYLDSMEQIKARLFAAEDSADKFLQGDCNYIGDLEFACLQLRKALELIGFSGMIAEIDAYSAMRPKFNKEWKFARVLDDLNRISQNSLPFKVRREKSLQAGINWHFVPQKEFALSHDQLSEWHGRLNEHLHARNPYSKSEDSRLASLRVKSNVTDILTLLGDHAFLRFDHSGGFLVSLNARAEAVTLAEFEANNDVH
ncbi:MAG: hypothetical protein ACSHXW_07960 [Yoonia sp.]